MLAAGLIAGEALIGILFAALAYFEKDVPAIFAQPGFGISLLIFGLIGWILVRFSLKNAGNPDQPAPPSTPV